MANATCTDGRVSGTGQDTPKMCVLSRPASPLRQRDMAGHCPVLSCCPVLNIQEPLVVVRLSLATEFAKVVA